MSCLGGTAPQKLGEVRSHLIGMNPFSYKRFVFIK